MQKTHCKWGHDIATVGRYRYGTCKACAKRTSAEWNKQNYSLKVRDIMRESNWKHDGIKITVLEYNQRFQLQNGCCLICKRRQSELKTRLAVDHDHITGEIRGLLCFSCNTLYERYLKYKFALMTYEQRGQYGN